MVIRFATTAALLVALLAVDACEPAHQPPPSADQQLALAVAPQAEEERALEELRKTFYVEQTRDYDQPGAPVVAAKIYKLSHTDEGAALDDKLAPIAVLRHLRQMKLSIGEVTGSGFKHFFTLDKLKDLEIDCRDLDDAGLQSLPTLTNLESINVFSLKLTETGWAELCRFPNLKKIRASLIAQRGVERLSECPSLISFETDSEKIGDGELAAISKLKNLEHLFFATNGIVTGNGITQITALKSLRWLFLRIPLLTADSIARLRDMPQLDQLELFSPSFDDTFAEEISSWGRLRHLHIGLTAKLTDDGLKQISKMTRLEFLFLHYVYGITDHGMNFIGRMTQLRHLSLNVSGVSNGGMAKIAPLIQLRSLKLSVDNASNKPILDLNPLAGMTELEKLELFNLPVTDSSVPLLVRFKKLKEMDIRGTKMTDEGIQRLRTELPKVKILTSPAR